MDNLSPERKFQIKFILGCFGVTAVCGAVYFWGPISLSAAAGSFGVLAFFLGAVALSVS